jgi:transposase
MLRRQALSAVPPETIRVAQAAFPKGHPYLRLADELGSVFTDDTFAGLFPPHGQPAFSPWRLALVTILQYAEGLSDRRAADAVRSRIDWKYLLRLELTDPGVDGSVLSEFRTRLIAGGAEALLLETLLTWCREHQLLKARGQQRTDSTHVLAAVRALNRVELAAETMRHALNSFAVVAPEWLRSISQPAWLERYSRRAEDDRRGHERSARSPGPEDRDRRVRSPHRGVRPHRSAVGVAPPGGGDAPPDLGAAVLWGRRSRALAHGAARHPALDAHPQLAL